MTTNQKIICAVLISLAWGGLAIVGKTPVDQFVSALRDMLIAMGVVGISTGKKE